MTPEEKAKELIEKFGFCLKNDDKRAALIVVDEILTIVESVKTVGEYWEKVKTIIESSQKL